MCIIVYKPAQIALPTEDKLKTCFENNPDGAGFAWYVPSENIWNVEKGFMTFKAFMDAFSSQNFTVADILFCHFRIGTSGLKDGGNTHPFPVTSILEDMRHMRYKSEGVACHNGVCGAGEGQFNDSMIAIRDYIAPLWPHLHETRIPEILDKALTGGTSKWIVTKNEQIWLFGAFNEDLGIKYSNHTHENPRYRSYSYGTSSGYMHNGVWVPFSKSSSAFVGSSEVKKLAGEHTKSEDGVVWESFSSPGKLKKSLSRAARGNVGKIVGVVSESGQTQFTAKSKEIINESVGYLVCPSCFEHKMLMDSNYNIGDSICLSCGAVFQDGTGKVLLYDLNIRRTKRGEHAELKRKKHLDSKDRQKIIDGTPSDDLYSMGMY